MLYAGPSGPSMTHPPPRPIACGQGPPLSLIVPASPAAATLLPARRDNPARPDQSLPLPLARSAPRRDGRAPLLAPSATVRPRFKVALRGLFSDLAIGQMPTAAQRAMRVCVGAVTAGLSRRIAAQRTNAGPSATSARVPVRHGVSFAFGRRCCAVMPGGCAGRSRCAGSVRLRRARSGVPRRLR